MIPRKVALKKVNRETELNTMNVYAHILPYPISSGKTAGEGDGHSEKLEIVYVPLFLSSLG